ncbi:hypothetical protein QZH41_012642, partial [Actinostola sp. cb2023]
MIFHRHPRNLQALAEAYSHADSWETRRQILSIMSGIASFKAIAFYIPGLTSYRYSLANLHRLQYGCGAPLEHIPTLRLRVDRWQLDHFLSFITSPHLVQDMPFGKKVLKLSSGQMIEVPNVIRTMIPKRIARQYTQYCEETTFKPFSERTMLRVLSECKASVRKSLQGLDYFAADGARAFDDLTALVRQLGALRQAKDWEVQQIELLKAAKLYLKGDFKVHLGTSSEAAYHCMVFALSDPTNPDLRQQCDHKHEEVCHQCDNLDSTLSGITYVVAEASFATEDDRDEATYIANSATIAIQSWKCHLLRSARQDQARLDVIDTLDSKTVLIVNDWVMKFLPRGIVSHRQTGLASAVSPGIYLWCTGDLTGSCNGKASFTLSSLAAREALLSLGPKISKEGRFNDNQKSYLTIKFQIGQRTGRKFDADEVARADATSA